MTQLHERVVPLSGVSVALAGVWQYVEAYHWYYEAVCDYTTGNRHLDCECPVCLCHERDEKGSKAKRAIRCNWRSGHSKNLKNIRSIVAPSKHFYERNTYSNESNFANVF